MTDINDTHNVSRKKIGASSGTVFNQMCRIASVSNKIGKAKNQVRKNEYFEPKHIRACI